MPRYWPPGAADVTGLDVPVGPAPRARPWMMRATGHAVCGYERPWSCQAAYLPADSDVVTGIDRLVAYGAVTWPRLRVSWRR